MKFKSTAQTGQGLLEVLAALAVGTILIVALVSLSIKANVNSDTSRTRNEAGKLAEQGLEVIRFIKAYDPQPLVGCPGNCNNMLNIASNAGGADASCNSSDGPGGGNVTWSAFYTLDINDNCPTSLLGQPSPWGRIGVLHYQFALSSQDNTDSLPRNPPCEPWCLHLATDEIRYYYVTQGNITFTRAVYIADTPVSSGGVSHCNDTLDYTKMKQFTIVVSWSDELGNHQSIVQDCIGA